MNHDLVVRIKREHLHEMCRSNRFDEEEIYRQAMIRVREEDLFLEPTRPADTKSPYRAALHLAKDIMRLEYKHLAATEPELALGCPGWWELPSEKEYVEELRKERKAEKLAAGSKPDEPTSEPEEKDDLG